MTAGIFVEHESFHFSIPNIAHEDLTAGVPARKVGSLSLSIDSSFKRKGRPSLFYLGSEVHSSPAPNFVTVWFNALKISTDERASHSGGVSCRAIKQGMVEVHTRGFILKTIQWHIHAGSWSIVYCLADSPYKALYKVLMNIN